MSIVKLSAFAAATLVSLAVAQVPAQAASPLTNRFLTNLQPNVDFLDQSSRMALDHSTSQRLRDYARTEAIEQTHADNDVDEWIRADLAANNVLASMATESIATGDLQTGRSVAIDAPAPEPVAVPDTRQPMGQADLDRLSGLSGPSFDAQYTLSQLEALRQLEADYSTYIAKGDDPMLLGIANRELPQIEHRIAQLRKM